VLTGTEIGSYRTGGLDLAGLIERILAGTDIARLRLSSLQPQEITPGFIRLWGNGRLCRHFHLSLQSGSDSVLERMKRKYTTTDYKEAVSLIRDTAPEAAITTDIIVGFPAESDEEFEETFNFSQQMEFARIHVFAFSPRPGTQAAGMPDPVKSPVKRERSQRMLALARESARRFARRFLGKHMMVLWEKKSGGTWSGHTDNYLKVYTESNDDLSNQLRPARLEEIRGDGVWGNL
ncbi:radical SAM protein, partial [Chloroflexota bacterium]